MSTKHNKAHLMDPLPLVLTKDTISPNTRSPPSSSSSSEKWESTPLCVLPNGQIPGCAGRRHHPVWLRLHRHQPDRWRQPHSPQRRDQTSWCYATTCLRFTSNLTSLTWFSFARSVNVSQCMYCRCRVSLLTTASLWNHRPAGSQRNDTNHWWCDFAAITSNKFSLMPPVEGTFIYFIWMTTAEDHIYRSLSKTVLRTC